MSHLLGSLARSVGGTCFSCPASGLTIRLHLPLLAHASDEWIWGCLKIRGSDSLMFDILSIQSKRGSQQNDEYIHIHIDIYIYT